MIQLNTVIFNDMDKEKLIRLTKGKVSGFVEKARKRKELKNNGVLDNVIKCDCELEIHERSKMELDYNKCMDCKKEIE